MVSMVYTCVRYVPRTAVLCADVVDALADVVGAPPVVDLEPEVAAEVAMDVVLADVEAEEVPEAAVVAAAEAEELAAVDVT